MVQGTSGGRPMARDMPPQSQYTAYPSGGYQKAQRAALWPWTTQQFPQHTLAFKNRAYPGMYSIDYSDYTDCIAYQTRRLHNKASHGRGKYRESLTEETNTEK